MRRVAKELGENLGDDELQVRALALVAAVKRISSRRCSGLTHCSGICRR